MLHRADALFVGTPLDGCAESPGVAMQRQLLEEQRLELLGERIDADLRTGCYDGLAAELTTLTRAHPFHETFHGPARRVLALTGDRLTPYRPTGTPTSASTTSLAWPLGPGWTESTSRCSVRRSPRPSPPNVCQLRAAVEPRRR